MGFSFDAMIEQSEQILEEAYLRNNKDRNGKTIDNYYDSKYINKVFKGELMETLRGNISKGMQKVLNKLYSDFQKNEKEGLKSQILSEKPQTSSCSQQTDVEGLSKVKQMYK